MSAHFNHLLSPSLKLSRPTFVIRTGAYSPLEPFARVRECCVRALAQVHQAMRQSRTEPVSNPKVSFSAHQSHFPVLRDNASRWSVAVEGAASSLLTSLSLICSRNDSRSPNSITTPRKRGHEKPTKYAASIAVQTFF